MAEAYRVILADDHPVVRSGVRLALTGFNVVAECSNSTELFAALELHQTDVVVTDYSMPGGIYQDGLIMLDRLYRLYPHIRVIVLTLLKNPAILSKIACSPVHGILNKEGDTTEIKLAIVRAMSGLRFQGANVKLALESANLAHKAESIPLSARELEVLRLFVGGLGMTQIAASTRRSIKTVSNQKQSALRKLGCSNDAELFQLNAAEGFGDMLSVKHQR